MEREREGRDRERERERANPVYLAGGDVRTLRTIGQFGVIRPRDLGTYRYENSQREMKAAVDRLRSAGLVREYTVIDYRLAERRLPVVMLTRKGARDLAKLNPEERYRVWTDLRNRPPKSREAAHDAMLYPATERAAIRIRAAGGTVERVYTGSQLMRERGNKKLSPADTAALAERLALPVVRDRILFPDAQIVYRDKQGETQVENLEVTTPSYSGAWTSMKREAGFSLQPAVSFTHAKSPIHDRHRIW